MQGCGQCSRHREDETAAELAELMARYLALWDEHAAPEGRLGRGG